MSQQQYSVEKIENESHTAYLHRCRPVFYAWCEKFNKERSPYTMREWDEKYNSARMVNTNDDYCKELGIITQYRTIFSLVWTGEIYNDSLKNLAVSDPKETRMQMSYKVRGRWINTEDIGKNEVDIQALCELFQKAIDSKLRKIRTVAGGSVAIAKKVMIKAVENSTVQDAPPTGKRKTSPTPPKLKTTRRKKLGQR